MTPANRLHAMGQSLWLDNITRELLTSGTLKRYLDTWSVTGLTSNPSIFDKAIRGSTDYDADIRRKVAQGRRGEALFFDMAVDDLRRAADLFAPVFERTHGVDGWVSLEVSPLLAFDTQRTLASAKELHALAERPNLFIKIPGTAQGVPAIEEAIFAGVPINVTLLFSTAQYLASAEAWLRGIERRIDAGLSAHVPSVASLFVSRWDVAVATQVDAPLHNRLGIAMARQCYREYNRLLASPRWRRAMNAGAPVQRLLMASTGTKDKNAPDTLYVEALAAPLTINTIPEATLKALVDHGQIGAVIPDDGGNCESELKAFRDAGVNIDALAARLQKEGTDAFVESWKELLQVIEARSTELAVKA